jgi:hypothetical protein
LQHHGVGVGVAKKLRDVVDAVVPAPEIEGDDTQGPLASGRGVLGGALQG